MQRRLMPSSKMETQLNVSQTAEMHGHVTQFRNGDVVVGIVHDLVELFGNHSYRTTNLRYLPALKFYVISNGHLMSATALIRDLLRGHKTHMPGEIAFELVDVSDEQALQEQVFIQLSESTTPHPNLVDAFRTTIETLGKLLNIKLICGGITQT